MKHLDDVRRSGGMATAVLLSLACSAAGGGGDTRSGGVADDDMSGVGDAPDVGMAGPAPAPSAVNSAPPLLPTSGSSASVPRAPAAGGENNPPPVGFQPGPPPPSSSTGSGVAPTPAQPPAAPPSEGDDPAAEDPGETPPVLEGFIRGPAPTAASATRPGPFDVDVVIFGLRDGPEYGSQTLHIPEGAEPPFAGVVVVPGFISPEASTRPWGPFLASHGIVTLTIGTNTGGDLPEVRARALLDAIETLKAENTRALSPVEGQMALDRFAVMGWSMGGGGTLIAASAHPELRAAVTLAAWSPGARFADDRVPTLLLAGSVDIVAGGQSQGFFESIPESTPKMLFEVVAGGHDIANDPDSAGGEIGLYGLSWLKVFLEGDERYRQFLLETPTRQSDFRTNL